MTTCLKIKTGTFGTLTLLAALMLSACAGPGGPVAPPVAATPEVDVPRVAGSSWHIFRTLASYSGGPYDFGVVTFQPNGVLSYTSPRNATYSGIWKQTGNKIFFQHDSTILTKLDCEFDGVVFRNSMSGSGKDKHDEKWTWTAKSSDVNLTAANSAAPGVTGGQAATIKPIESADPELERSASLSGYVAACNDFRNKPRDASRYAEYIKSKYGPEKAYMESFTREYNRVYKQHEAERQATPPWAR